MPKRNWVKHRPLFASPVPPEVRKPKLVLRVLPIVWLGIKRTCTVLGGFVLFIAFLTFMAASNLSEGERPAAIPREMVLYLPLDEEPGEIPIPAGPFSAQPPTVHELVEAIDRAATDKRVKGMFARMDEGTFAMARSEELRAAIKRFQEKGKFAYIYSPSYGQGAGDLGRYYLASAFGELWMQPMGIVSIGGVRAEVPFARDTLDKIGVAPQFYKRKEYKTAYESFTNKTMSDENREEISALIDDMKAEILKDVPAERGLEPAAFARLVDKGLFTAPEALEAKLITKADYADVLVERIKKDVTGDPEASDDLFVDAGDYLERVRHEDSEKSFVRAFTGERPQVALIYVVGAIMDTNMGGEETAAADEIAPAILDAADDENIEAIIIRIDSPGGSPGASESILRAVDRAKQKGKPVIVSMGPTAASGGYWVAAYADQIFALPVTLTGSIGVLGGKVSLAELWKKVGVNWDRSVAWGENAGLWSLNTPFSKSEEERVNAMLDHVYKSFIERVSKGRGLNPEAVEKIARGRVWTGAEAVKIGLVDQLGGLREATQYTAKILGEKDASGIDVIVLPKPKTALERFIELVQDQGSVYEGFKFQGRVGKVFGPFLQDAAVYQNSGGLMTYEPLRVE